MDLTGNYVFITLSNLYNIGLPVGKQKLGHTLFGQMVAGWWWVSLLKICCCPLLIILVNHCWVLHAPPENVSYLRRYQSVGKK